ncbi:hypothetical protein OG339_48275 (plasmid) [Streptosporangium sp. NBC_01495]|uniref:hypothetical protein n=1 Tax=Streptosporangium sp. NBC_01495 TaxID=2903899 RepID=UPI002E31EC38|nr:hypothetical protein [Streptosporangium sp. NBC_01495]
MARHLTHHANKAGHLTNMGKIIGLYASHHRVGKRTAWKDLGRLVGLGMLRKTLGAAPGQPAEYTLCWDLARLPDDFPKSLGRAVEMVADDPAERATKRPTLASIHRGLAECVTVQYGSRTSLRPIHSRGCGLVHTSPYVYDGLTPPLTELDPDGGQDERKAELWGDKTVSERLEEAREVLVRCRRAWVIQRAGWVPEGAEAPSKAGMASLEHLIELLLRHLPVSEVEELLSDQVRSARNMVGLVQWRVGRVLRDIRRRHRIEVDEAGVRHAAWMAERQARWESQSEVRHAAIAEARRLQEQRAASLDAARWRRSDATAAATRWATEPEWLLPVDDAEESVATEQETARWRAIARARQERAERKLVGIPAD